MFSPDVYMERRRLLMEKVGSGIILLLGNDESPMNFRDNIYPFRQDSSFLYYFGLDKAGYNGLIDCDRNEAWLFADDLTIDDMVWTGPLPTVAGLARRSGVRRTGSSAALAEKLTPFRRDLASEGDSGRVHFLPPYREANAIKLLSWLQLGQHRTFDDVLETTALFASEKLIDAVADQRNHKAAEEIEELEKAVSISTDMHVAAMKMCRSGLAEYQIAAEMERVARAAGGRLSFPVIATRDGQTLHNHYQGNILKEGDMLLVDAGAETLSGYAGDLSSTIPVGGCFSNRQKDIYTLTLASHEKAIELLGPGRTFLDIYYEASRVIVEGLKDLGLMKGSTDDALREGAHAMFFPCGLGHMMGLDVHDMEDLGEETVGYGGKAKSTQFGVKSLRLGRELEPGFVLTIEPGIYFIPQLMDLWEGEGRHKAFLDYGKLRGYRNFGGIRNEEDFLITPNGARRLGKAKPKTIDEVEAITGS